MLALLPLLFLGGRAAAPSPTPEEPPPLSHWVELLKSTNARDRAEAALEILSLPKGDARPALHEVMEALATAPDAQTRVRCAGILKKTGVDEETGAALAKAAGDDDRDVRKKAVEGLATALPIAAKYRADLEKAAVKDENVAALLDQLPTAHATVVSELTDAAIDDAIAFGVALAASTDETKAFLREYSLGDTQVITPWLRVAMAARDAKSKYLPFDRAQVTKDMRALTFALTAPGVPPHREIGFPAINVKHAVVAGGAGADATITQPQSISSTTQEWKNGFGNVVASTQGVVAIFPLALLKEGNEVRVIPEGGKEIVYHFGLIRDTTTFNLGRMR